jgi:GNAT superfamily N-acetyltransferase
MSANLVVRQIGSKDEDDWRLLWTGYLEFYDASLPAEVYDTTFARILAGNDGAEWEPRGLLAEVAGRPVGLVHFMFQRHCWRVEKVCYLQDLYAVPEMRGNGIGRALIEAVYAVSDRAGYPSVYWMTQDFNTTARQLYDRIGTRTPFIKYTR